MQSSEGALRVRESRLQARDDGVRIVKAAAADDDDVKGAGLEQALDDFKAKAGVGTGDEGDFLRHEWKVAQDWAIRNESVGEDPVSLYELSSTCSYIVDSQPWTFVMVS